MATRGGRQGRGGRGGGNTDGRNRSRGGSRGKGRGNSEFRGENRGGRGAHRPRGNHDDNPEGMLQPNIGAARRFWNMEHIRRLAAIRGDEIVNTVFDDQLPFFNLLQDHRTIENSSKIRLVIQIIYNITNCSNPQEEKVVVLLSQIGSDTFAMFHLNLAMFIRKMPLEQAQKERDENFRTFNQLVHICTQMLTICPQHCAHLLPVHDLCGTAVTLEQSNPRYSVLVSSCDELKKLHTQVTSHNNRQSIDRPNRGTRAPKENYCDMPILPRVAEITKNSKPELECNIVEGSYTDWNHYLGVQFCLLREDFISPLRQGISDYSHGDYYRSKQNIRVYNHVYVNEPVCLYTGIGFKLQFDVSHLNHVHWEHSRRLIFGSLLCLSSDEFTTVLFASVVKRDPKLLREGCITVKFEGDVNGFEIEPQTEFTMVESTAYFEAYRHILHRLQTVKTRPPFKAYIVDCKPPKPLPPPSYLRGNQHACFDLTALGVKDPVQLLDRRSWPHRDEVHLDESQLKAVQMALTQELSLIQGPPGTGKTYIGLKIVEILLQNKNVWDPNTTSPILVVCYTNHALDQFLEGILKFDNKTRIVRIGGRSKSSELEPYMLRNIMDQCHNARSFVHHQYKPWREARADMKKEQRSICEVMHNVSNMSMEGKQKILNFHTLERVMDPDHANQLRALLNKYNVTEEGKEIEFWLGIWFFASKDEELDEPPIIDEDPKIDEDLLATEQVALPDAAARGNTPADVLPRLAEGDAEEELAEVDAEAVLLENDRIIDGERIELEPIKLDDIPKSAPKKPGVHRDKYGWQVQQLSEKERKQRISRGMKSKPMSRERVQRIPDISKLEEKKRWSLYRYWVNQHLRECKRAVADHAEIYTHACEEFQEAQSELESSVLHTAAVVGMTTTGAAKYHSILHKIRPKIVIIEEAAEVLESHIVTTLTASTQQVILIGDHQQLRPKPNDYRLAIEYNLEVSLFERLVKNEIAFTTLEVQHRMRPEIAQLICPHIYEKLINAHSVCNYERIRGVQHDVFFVDHSVPEDDSYESDMMSHSNKFEAEFAVRLCHHFIKLGYQRSQITILTMYSGQLLKMKKMMPKTVFDGVRVSAVDDFQGEENDIIILSLVRSNDEGKIGFLKESNRVCVALSRAKKGFFVIGNFSMLREKDEPWPNIIDEMEKKGLIQKALPLCCSIHNKITLVSSGDDFNNVPEGGCLELCGTRLLCGHSCPRVCHPGIQDHMTYRCRKNCAKTLDCGHKCTGYCYQCSQGCNPCTAKIPKYLSCGHLVNFQCSVPVGSVVCPENCTKQLSCGHLCTERCSAPCTPQCKEKVIKDLPCGHRVRVSCYRPLSSIVCSKSCKEILLCGHPCAGTCSECHMGRLHKSCQSPCGRTLPCGHSCDFPCTNECPSCTQRCGNYCNHSRCIKKCGEPCVPCMEDCQWRCQHFRCTKKCGEMCDRRRCNRPCTKRLPKCGHPCIGLCGEKCPSLCRICDTATVTEIFFGEEDEPNARFIQLEDCDHIFEVSGLDQWMDQQDSGTDSKAVQIQFKCCPKCKTSVRRSLRYGNIIKQTLHDIEEVKKQISGIDKNRNELWKANKQKLLELLRDCFTKSCFKHVQKFFDKIREQLEPPTYTDKPAKKMPCCQLSLHHLNAIQYQLVNLPKMIRLLEVLQNLDYSSKFQFGHIVIGLTEVKGQLTTLCDFMIQDFIYDQIQIDVECEFNRISLLIEGCQLQKHAAKRISSDDVALISDIMLHIYYAGWQKDHNKITSSNATEYKTKLTEIGRKYGVGSITEAERIEIVKAVGLSKGHWYKCPNGHYYCIGECGGAMQVARCPECKAAIGGTSHRLTAGNVHAPEMDGSRHAAWSDAANLENYDPAIFR